MRRTYTLIIEGQPGAYSAYVPELPTILIAGESVDELSRNAREAIQVHLEDAYHISPTSIVKEVEVEIPLEGRPR